MINNKLSIIPLLLALMLTGCNKRESFELIHNEEALILSNQIFRGMYNRSFKEDFITKNPDEASLAGAREYFTLIKSATVKDPSILAANYDDAKEGLLEVAALNQPGMFHITQSVAARFLRNHFLKQPTINVEEVSFLTKQLITFKSIDLDVIVDGYLAIADTLNEEEKTYFISYIKTLRNELKEGLAEEFQTLQKEYQSVKGSKDAVGKVLAGKSLERIWKSCLYAEEKLDLE